MSEGPELKDFALLAELSEEERELVTDLLERLDLDPGEQLFCEGQEADSLVLIQTGTLDLTSARVGAVGQVGAGESLGALSLVSVGPREVTAVASEAARVWVLSRESFRRLCEDAPRAACRILEAALVDFAGAVRESLERFSGAPSGA